MRGKFIMKLRYISFFGALLLSSSIAIAGFLQPAPVTVTVNDDGSGTASGDMATARFADNDFDLIGCGIRTFDDGAGGVFEFGFCQAQDSTEVNGFCSTDRSDILDTLKATADYSFVTFSWNTDGECTRVGFSTQSFYIPEHLDSNLPDDDDDDDDSDD